MKAAMGVRAAIAVLVVSVSALLAPNVGAVVVHTQGHFLSFAPMRAVDPASVAGSVPAARKAAGLPFSVNGNLDYHGGAVMHSSAPYVLYWLPTGESLSSTTQNLMNRYFTDLAAASGASTNDFAVNRQFTDGSGFADYSQSFSAASQVLVDTDAYPSTASDCGQTSGFTACITNAQLASEVSTFAANNGLPNDGPNGSEPPQNAPIYFVVVPPDVNICFGGSTNANTCANNVFCAYHSGTTDGTNQFLYAAIPTFLASPSSPFPKGCQSDNNGAIQEPNADRIGDIAIKYISHEFSETVTDPFGQGWWNSNGGNEDGDNCNSVGSNANSFLPTLGGNATPQSPATYGTLYDQLINGNHYYTQSEWSNGDVGCKMQPTASALTATFSAPSSALVGAAVNLNPAGTAAAAGVSSFTWDFGDGTTQFDNSGSLPATLSHSYPSPGHYVVKLTVVDADGNLQTAAKLLTVVDETPSAAFTPPTGGQATRPVSFTGSGSDPDGTIVSYSWSFGDGHIATGAHVTHTFAHGGHFTVTLTVHDSGGMQGSVSHQVTIAAAPCVVPNVKGKSLTRAKSAIIAAHCTLGRVTRPKKHRKHKRLVVGRQSPSAGKVEPPGSKVGLALVYR